ncbi:zinc finger protein ZFP2-like [Cydia pomonella]|uniref:zinc finger protein ZFP2-like n=1 Tax=Cydia pomonella TaxID=82600 RepID=UPI002ADE9033|nr:zinc finger protein ZFP2-like [Cydia pomonella]
MNTCRTCLITSARNDISDLEKSIKDDKRKCIDIMAFCLDIKVTEDTKITTKLCDTCYRNIISFYNFKVLALENDAYLKSLNPLEKPADHNLTLYVDENGIKHENIVESDDFGPSVIEYCNREIKIEIDVKDDRQEDSEIIDNVKEEDTFADVDLDEEPLSVVQKVEYENFEDDSKEEAPEHNSGQRMLKCKACPKQFVTFGGRSKHYQTTHLGKRSKCDICYKEVVHLPEHKLRIHNPSGMRFNCSVCKRPFIKQAELDLHMLTHTKDYKFQCDVCQRKFSCKGLLSLHIRQVHEKERNYKCKHCPKAFFARKKLERHSRTHTSDVSVSKLGKEYQICEECGVSVVNLKTHAARHQPKDERRRLQCKACPKTFYTIGGRKRHYKTTHLGKIPRCDICNKQVVSVTEHKRRMHAPGELPFECAECGRRCASKSLLDVHMLTHTRDYKHECDVCQKKFSSKTFLSMHRREVHEKERNHQCEFCPKAFFKKDKLKEHIRCHTNERPYTCNECARSFTKKILLTKHLTSHSGVRKFLCKLCNKSFKTSGNLSVHMVSHTKEKRYPCAFCGARFGRSDHRNRHQLTAHKKHGQTEADKKPDS